MSLLKIFEAIEAERSVRREHDGGLLLRGSPEDRIAEITKLQNTSATREPEAIYELRW